jgi:uncharacterized iron-regulated membrane protein
MKIFFRRIHLYLSLAAGLVILTCCATGAILVFEKDIQTAFNKSRYYVAPAAQKLPLEQLTIYAQQHIANGKTNGVKVYTDNTRSAEISMSVKGKKKDAPPQNSTVYINPYTGQVLDVYNYRDTFFYQVFALHRWLLGGSKGVGKYIVGVATFIFLFILLTGIILWWPKTKKILVQRLKIKSNAGWKRLNHDLHMVLGFYSAIILFLFAFTGLAWSFEWFNKGIYKVTNSPLKAPAPPESVYVNNAKTVSLDNALTAAATIYPQALSYNIALPKDSAGAITVSALSNNAVHESATDAVYIDQYSAAILGKMAYSERSLGARVRSTFKPVHTGSIWGTPSKIVAFIVCVLGCSFPVTGTIMWWNRTRKKKNKRAISLKKQPGYSSV